jgi:predicted dehydrogenase
MLKIGLIGCGLMGNTHNKVWKALSENNDIGLIAGADCIKSNREKILE